MHRRNFIRTLIMGASATLLTSCGIPGISPAAKAPTVINKDSTNELQQEGRNMVDHKLKDGNHPFLESVSFSFDPLTSEGKIVAEPVYKKEGAAISNQRRNTGKQWVYL